MASDPDEAETAAAETDGAGEGLAWFLVSVADAFADALAWEKADCCPTCGRPLRWASDPGIIEADP
jgi:hypothetical protein